MQIPLSSDDTVNEPLDKIVENGMNITINRVEFKEITEKEYKYNISAFFEKAYILEWPDDCIREKSSINTRWNYVIKCTDAPTIKNNGKDYFPPYFKQAKLRHDHFSFVFAKK